MDILALNPFFWAVIGLFGLFGATTAVNTSYGKKHPAFAKISAFLFFIGRLIVVMPFIPQPRFQHTISTLILGFGFGVASLIFILPVLKTQPLTAPSTRMKLQTSGLYSIVRHPFYLGEILFSLSISILFKSWIGLALIPIWWAGLILHITNEEESIQKVLGPYYMEYKARVKGRIIPLFPLLKEPKIPKYPFKNLVFKGGGVKGTAYLGVLRELHQYGILNQVQRVAGSSAGAITATLLSFNRDIDKTIQLLDSLDYRKVPQLKSEYEAKDPEWLPKFIGKEITKISGDLEAAQRLVNKYGWYTSEYFYHWLKNVIAEHCDGNPMATFEDFRRLGFRDLYIVSTNLSDLSVAVFCADRTPDIAVANAVRFSMSIPLFFESVQFDGKQLGVGDYFVDGGVLMNYPIHFFDQEEFKKNNLWYVDGTNWETLGFYLYSSSEVVVKEKKIGSIMDFISHLYECYNISLQIAEIDNNPTDQRRSVKIDTSFVQATDFHITPEHEDYLRLINTGKQATKEFLERYDNPSMLRNW
jgi:NTE family protein